MILLLITLACSDKKDEPAKPAEDAVETDTLGGQNAAENDAFPSRFEDSKSCVAYSGQVFCHVLGSTLKSFVGGLSANMAALNHQGGAAEQMINALQLSFALDAEVAGTAPILPTVEQSVIEQHGVELVAARGMLAEAGGYDGGKNGW